MKPSETANEPSSGYYEKYWERSDGWSPSGGALDPDEKQLFDEHLRPGMLCLDYGCGDGRRYGRALQESGIDYRGFDVSAAAVKQARESGLNVQQFSGTGQTSLASAECDVVICFEVFEHLLEPNSALEEIRRVLKPGGVLIASVPNIGYFPTRLEFLLTGFFNPGGSPLTARKTPWNDPHIRFFSPQTLKRFLLSNHFVAVKLVPQQLDLGSLPYIYKTESLKKFLRSASAPLRWLGRAMPSLFSPRLFVVGRR